MTVITAPYRNITAAILAGGRGARLGGVDKGLELLAGQALVAHIITALKPQCGMILINANRHSEKYRDYGYTVIADDSADFHGPLAGMLAALRAAETEFVLCVPCDAPFVSTQLAQRLWNAMVESAAPASVACDNDGLQPVYVLLSKPLIGGLNDYLNSGGRRVSEWLQSIGVATVDFSDSPQMFLNMNTEHDRLRLRQHVERRDD